MQIHRFFLSSKSVDKHRVTICDRKIVYQIRKVLRLSKGDLFEALDGSGWLFTCQIESITPDSVITKIVKQKEIGLLPSIRISVALPLLRGGRFELAIQKLTELGATGIIPVCCQRSVIRTTDDTKLNHFRAIIREAVEQSEGTFLPSLHGLTSFTDLVTNKSLSLTNYMPILCLERSDADRHMLQHLLYEQQGSSVPPENILIVVGPEGGLTPEEVALAKRHHFNLVSLGNRVLRSETAAIFALAQVVARFDR